MKSYVLTSTIRGAVDQPRGSVVELTDDLANSPLYKSRIRPADVELVVPKRAKRRGKKKAEAQADAE